MTNLCKKLMNLLGNMPNQPSKFRTKASMEINDDSRGTYKANSQSKFKTSILKSRLCDYSDACVLAKGTITVVGVRLTAALI